MARKKTTATRVNVKNQLSARLRHVRQEVFGEHGGPELARRLNLPARTWYNYETGVTVPAEILLGFMEETGANSSWLLTGVGPKYRRNVEDQILSELSPEQLIRRGLEKLEQRPNEVVLVAPENMPAEASSDFVAVPLVSLSALAEPALGAQLVEGHILAYREWIPHPRDTVAVRLEDDAMHPILPEGSVAAVDRATRDPRLLQGRLVAARPEGVPVIRWMEVSGKHLIFRTNQSASEFPILPVEWNGRDPKDLLIGQVVWSWSKFGA